VCGTPATYLFWDQLHPSATGQQLIADAAFDVVPEPATFAVLATGLGMLLLLRRQVRNGSVAPVCQASRNS
jgi:phospholipase/lecithinase/hemolysin